MTPENIQQGHLWKDFANSLTEPTNSICGLALNGIQYILLGINAWVQPILLSVVSHSRTRQALALPIPVDESTWSLLIPTTNLFPWCLKCLLPSGHSKPSSTSTIRYGSSLGLSLATHSVQASRRFSQRDSSFILRASLNTR